MERPPQPRQRDFPPIIRHIFRSERSTGNPVRAPLVEQRGILAELERYPELRH